MKLISERDLIELARSLHSDAKTWHYHLLTPNCLFNSSAQYALVLEDISMGEVFILYSDAAKIDLSSELATMLHGKEVMDNANARTDYIPNQIVARMLILINELKREKIIWHHHVFFPECTFNSNLGQYKLVVENPKTLTYLESISSYEPIEELKQIESAFYSQAM
jgi:hypothetical protein